MNPYESSTNGYSNEIGFIHIRHFPDNNIQLIIGILSNHFIWFLQLMQKLLGDIIEISSGNLNLITLIKLPIDRHNRKIKK